MDVIIPKNTKFPITKKEIYLTTEDKQEIISFEVYEGDEECVKDDYLLAEFEIKNLTKRFKGETRIELTSDLILNVTAQELGKTNEKLYAVNLD